MVAERNPIEGDTASSAAKFIRMQGFWWRHGLLQNFKGPFETGECALLASNLTAHRLQRRIELTGIRDDHNQIASSKVPSRRVADTYPQNQSSSDRYKNAITDCQAPLSGDRA